jgi:hypothetical protein
MNRPESKELLHYKERARRLTCSGSIMFAQTDILTASPLEPLSSAAADCFFCGDVQPEERAHLLLEPKIELPHIVKLASHSPQHSSLYKEETVKMA